MFVFRRIVIVGVLLLSAGAALAAAGGVMSVQIKEGQVRSTPSFLGKIVAALNYGDRVEVLEEQNAWARISLSGDPDQGWIHVSALTDKQIVLKPGAKDVQRAATSDEVALAGRGFNAEVEQRYKSREGLDYTWIDRMERVNFSPAQRLKFLKDGRVTPQGG